LQSTQYSLDSIRNDFPVLERKVRDNKTLVYLDNAATTQKPIQVIDAITDYYKNHNSNIHRAVHALAEESTEAFEVTRSKVAKFLNVANSDEIIFVRGTTEAINLVAYAWGRDNVQKGDIVVTTEYEHHSNIVPWQILTQETGAELRYIDIDKTNQRHSTPRGLHSRIFGLVLLNERIDLHAAARRSILSLSNTKPKIRECNPLGVEWR
jgi:cysteine desulfurase/selenocysteine lyase